MRQPVLFPMNAEKTGAMIPTVAIRATARKEETDNAAPVGDAISATTAAMIDATTAGEIAAIKGAKSKNMWKRPRTSAC